MYECFTKKRSQIYTFLPLIYFLWVTVSVCATYLQENKGRLKILEELEELGMLKELGLLDGTME